MPKLKPRAVRERIIVPSVRGSEVACAQRSRVGHREDALKVFDFGDSSVNVHAAQFGCTCNKHTKFASASFSAGFSATSLKYLAG